jgi:hypothetical protein
LGINNEVVEIEYVRGSGRGHCTITILLIGHERAEVDGFVV